MFDNPQMPSEPRPCNNGTSCTKRQHSYKHPLHFYNPRGQPCSVLRPSTLTTAAECPLYSDKFKFQTPFPRFPGAMLTPGCWSSICHVGLQKPVFETAFGAEWGARSQGQWAQRATAAVGPQTQHGVPPCCPGSLRAHTQLSQRCGFSEPDRGHLWQ